MSASITRSFAEFSKRELQSAVVTVNARRKRGLYFSLLVGFGVFLVLAGAVYLFFSPYAELMGKHGISYWPLLFLAPASLALIGFSLVYILTLRSAVREFRESLIGKMAEYIDASIVHDPGKTIPEEELQGELLATLGGRALPGTDQFRGRVPGAAAHFSDLRLKRKGADGKDEMLTGLYFYATMDRSFALPIMVFPSTEEVIRSGLETKLRASGETMVTGLLRLDDPVLRRQILVPSGGEEFVLGLAGSPAYARLEELRKSGANLSLSCRGDNLRVAILSKSGRMDLPGMFEEFDLALCRDFCAMARLCLDFAQSLSERPDLWRSEKTATGQ
jgi:hypothetical protein